MHSLLDAKAVTLSTTTTTWQRVDAGKTDEATEEAISQLCARGLMEVRIVAIIEMGDKSQPKVRYVGGGEWWKLLEKKLDKLVPTTWMGRDGKPKQNLLMRANVVAIRLTSDGIDYKQAIADGTWHKWVDSRPKKVKAFLRCDGIATREGHSPDYRSVNWFGTDYSFTKNQALCVKELWAAWKNGTPEVDGLTAIVQADVCQTRLLDVFRLGRKMHPAWNTMIVAGTTKGAYRLSEPRLTEKPAAKRSRKTHR